MALLAQPFYPDGLGEVSAEGLPGQGTLADWAAFVGSRHGVSRPYLLGDTARLLLQMETHAPPSQAQ